MNNYIKFRSFLKPLVLLFIIGILSNFTGCFGCPYSFSGASVAPHLKSVAIPFAEDRSGSAEPRLRELLTEKLTQKFIDDNNLQIAEKSSADALLQCVIVSLSDVPAIVSAGENVASRRITITVQVTFKDLVQRRTVFEKQFSNYGDYSGGISERNSGIDDAINKISDDILLDTVSGW
ncbi:MAG: LPS assembly lipoprotein LptE [Ignavibacteriaceae bacterium]|nr:LPS assembly lipoprotein LptE [Ignavibacteriaceae bacterium]